MPLKNIEERMRYEREYHSNRYAKDPRYRARKKAYNRKYRKKHRNQILKQNAERYAKYPWLPHLENARHRCTNPNSKDYKYYGGKGIRMLLTKLEIEILYKRDHADQMEKPSIDRIDSNRDYCFENCRFIEQSENTIRSNNPSLTVELVSQALL